EVDPRAALAEEERCGRVAQTGSGGDLLKGPVPPVVIQPVALALAADEQVEPAVVVVVRPRRTVGVDRLGKSGLLRHGRKRAVAVIAEQAGPNCKRQPGPPRNEYVFMSIIIVVSLITDQSPQLVEHAGLAGVVRESAVSLVTVIGHGLTRVDR